MADTVSMDPKTRRAAGQSCSWKTIYTEMQDIQAVFPFFRKEFEAKRKQLRPRFAGALLASEDELVLD